MNSPPPPPLANDPVGGPYSELDSSEFQNFIGLKCTQKEEEHPKAFAKQFIKILQSTQLQIYMS